MEVLQPFRRIRGIKCLQLNHSFLDLSFTFAMLLFVYMK